MSASNTVLENKSALVAPLKLVLIGTAESGKSALFRRINGDQLFSQNYKPTIGADFGTKNYYTDDFSSIKINIWDTAGQDRFLSLLKNYFRDVDIAVFILDGSQELSKQQNWLLERNEEFPANASNTIRILVVTKGDLERKITDAEIDTFKEKMNIVDHVFSSAKNNELEELNKFLLTKSQEVLQARKSAQADLATFDRAIRCVKNSVVRTKESTSEAGERFLVELRKLKDRTLNELNSNKLSREEAEGLASDSLRLATKVADLSVRRSDIEYFHKCTAPYKKTSLSTILSAVIGAAIGIFVGVMIGMAMVGPGAALMALHFGVLGGTLGGAVFGAASFWCSKWFMERNHPLPQLEKAANEVVSKSAVPSNRQ